MKHFLRPNRRTEFVVLLGLGAGLMLGAKAGQSQSPQIVELLPGASPLLHTATPQGYLGVWVDDVDNEKAQTLKLKEVKGALITLIDHDAPAGQIGLHVNDVIVQLNGQPVEGAEQLRRMLREIPPGRKVSLEFSREGNVQTTSVELVDHRAMEHTIWTNLGKNNNLPVQTPSMGILAGGGDVPLPGVFHTPLFGGTLTVGAMVEPLTGQTAEYLGVPSGLMIKSVARKSEAAVAGFKPLDVILKVGPDSITTIGDWERALRSNEGKQVQVTILRDKKQQTLNLQVDSNKRKTSEMMLESCDGFDACPLAAEAELAEINPDADMFFADTDGAGIGGLAFDPKQMQQFEQAFKVDPQAMQQMRAQMEEFSKNFNANEFKIDPKAMNEFQDQLRDEMKQMQQGFKMDEFKIDPKEMEKMKRQMQQFGRDWPSETLPELDWRSEPISFRL